MRRIARPTRLLLACAALIITSACGDDRPPLASAAGGAAAGAGAVAGAAAGAGEPSKQADPARGRRLIAERGCTACHTVPGVGGPASKVGPALDNMARQAYVAGLLPNTPDNLVRWLLDPPAINPRTAMPNTGLRTPDAEDIAAFLLLRAGTPEKTP